MKEKWKKMEGGKGGKRGRWAVGPFSISFLILIKKKQWDRCHHLRMVVSMHLWLMRWATMLPFIIEKHSKWKYATSTKTAAEFRLVLLFQESKHPYEGLTLGGDLTAHKLSLLHFSAFNSENPPLHLYQCVWEKQVLRKIRKKLLIHVNIEKRNNSWQNHFDLNLAKDLLNVHCS